MEKADLNKEQSGPSWTKPKETLKAWETAEDQEGEYGAGCDWEEEIALMPAISIWSISNQSALKH